MAGKAPGEIRVKLPNWDKRYFIPYFRDNEHCWHGLDNDDDPYLGDCSNDWQLWQPPKEVQDGDGGIMDPFVSYVLQNAKPLIKISFTNFEKMGKAEQRFIFDMMRHNLDFLIKETEVAGAEVVRR
jgi:hypothetical protein